MTYCPYTGQVVVNTAGMVSSVKLVSLKHSVPCSLSVVLDIYKENPRKCRVKSLEAPAMKIKTHLEWKISSLFILKKNQECYKTNCWFYLHTCKVYGYIFFI